MFNYLVIWFWQSYVIRSYTNYLSFNEISEGHLRSLFKYRDISVMWLFIIPKVQRNISDLKSIDPCAFYRDMNI